MKPLLCLLVKEAGSEAHTACPMVRLPSSACGYLHDSMKCLVFSLVNEQGCEDLFEGVFPGGEFCDLFLDACPRV